ncbi:HIG1 domain-containing protein [bacterium]|nr:HIG1 domain-containing protein [bacterium]
MPTEDDLVSEFFEEGRWGKIFRRLREEPLIPLGLGATIYALYQAAMSIQVGDHQRTNRMFRARVYAQGFTLVAMVGGSYYWRDDRMKRKELEKAMTEKKQMEKRERWLQELEERDREDRNWRTRFEEVAARAKEAEEASKAASRSLPGFSKSSIGGSRQGAGDKSKVASPAAEGSEKKTTGEALKQASEAVKAADKKGGSTQREIEKEEEDGGGG